MKRKILIIIGIALGAGLLIPVIHHYQLRFAVEKYISELKAKGEPMDLAQVIPPSVPPEQNGASLFTNASANLNNLYSEIANANFPPPTMRMVARTRAMIGWQQPDIRSSDGTNTWEDLGGKLAAAKTGLDFLRSLTNYPVLDFNLDYKKGFDLQLPYLASLKRAAQLLDASELYNLHQENPTNACADVRAMLALVKGETDERITISQLVRIAIASIGVGATWEILQSPDISDDDLAQLQQDWQSLEFTSALEKTLLFERVQHLQEFQQARQSSEKFDKIWEYFYAPDAPKPDISQFGMPKRRSLFLRKWDEIRWQWFWSYQDEMRGLPAFQAMIDATRMNETNNSFVLAKSSAGLKLDLNSAEDLRHFFAESVNALASTRAKAARLAAAQNVVITAIALKRYEIRHQKFPATLNDLTPDLLKTVPTDYMDGEPLRYRPNANGTYLLYSVGDNGVDDGGNPAPEKGVQTANTYWQNNRALDWVWPQPATDAEIQNYYAHPPK
jgi:hypothetical protein